MSESRATSPVRVVYVVASMIVGGTQTHLLQVFECLDRTRFSPYLFALRDGGGLIPTVESMDVPVRTFGMTGSLKNPTDLVGLAKMVAALKCIRPDIVHAYLMRGNFYGSVAGRLAGVDSIITSKRGSHEITGTAERAGIAVSNRLSSAITGNAPSVLEFTRETEPRFTCPTRMIPSGIDTARFDPQGLVDLREELGLGMRPVIGTAITWRPRKGFRMLFHAFALVKERIPDAALLIAGVGDWESGDSDPRACADELGLTDDIFLLGRRDDMPRVIATYDVFVLPSESEGMSNAVLEAMAIGRPVVATAVGGNPVVVDDGRTGFLVEYPDHAAMAAHLVDLFCDQEKRVRFGREGRQAVVDGFSAKSMVRQMEGLYEELVHEPGRLR